MKYTVWIVIMAEEPEAVKWEHSVQRVPIGPVTTDLTAAQGLVKEIIAAKEAADTANLDSVGDEELRKLAVVRAALDQATVSDEELLATYGVVREDEASDHSAEAVKGDTSYRVLQFIKSKMTDGGDPLMSYLDLTGPLADYAACEDWCREAKLSRKTTLQIAKFVADHFMVRIVMQHCKGGRQ